MRDIGIAIVGYGVASSLHAKALKDVKGAKLIAIVGRDLERAKEFAKEYDAIALSLEDALKRDDIDAFIIATPTGTHLDYVEKIAPYKKHLLVEKPLESNLERTDKLIDICEREGIILGAVFQHRFDDASLQIKEYIDRNLLGKPILGSVYVKWYRGQEYYDGRPWRKNVDQAGGGALALQASHSIDLLLWFFGKPKSVFSVLKTSLHKDIEVEDTAVVSIEFENDALGSIEASTAVYPGFPERLELHFEKGSAIIEGGNLVYLKTTDPNLPVIETGRAGATGASDPKAVDIKPITMMLQDFVDSIRENRKPKIDGKEGRKVVEILDAIRRSFLERKVITL